MKNILIAFCAPSLSIPLNYHHQVQSLLYHLLQVENTDIELHDKGVSYGARQYKLFTFSSLRGEKKIIDDQICFDKIIYLDVRSVREDFCNSLLKSLSANIELQLFGNPLMLNSVKWNDPKIKSNNLKIKMLSPLTVHKTDARGYINYLSPLDSQFAEEINNNFSRKYYAFYGHNPSANIIIKARAVGAQDKYLTLYKKAHNAGEKDIYITGWRGEYELSGQPEYLNFLYYCGLGARNSSGFGMFELV